MPIPGQIIPPRYSACGHGIEGDSGAEVDDDTRPAIAMKGGDSVYDAVCADFARVVVRIVRPVSVSDVTNMGAVLKYRCDMPPTSSREEALRWRR